MADKAKTDGLVQFIRTYLENRIQNEISKRKKRYEIGRHPRGHGSDHSRIAIHVNQ